MSAKIIHCEIGPYPRPMPLGMLDPMPEVKVDLDDGTKGKVLFSFYPDELQFREQEFLGLTEDEAHALRHRRDVQYLRS